LQNHVGSGVNYGTTHFTQNFLATGRRRIVKENPDAVGVDPFHDVTLCLFPSLPVYVATRFVEGVINGGNLVLVSALIL
jgi:hypothetical protein